MEQRICLGIGIVGKGFLCVAAKADMFVFIMDAGTEIWGAVFSFCRIYAWFVCTHYIVSKAHLVISSFVNHASMLPHLHSLYHT